MNAISTTRTIDKILSGASDPAALRTRARLLAAWLFVALSASFIATIARLGEVTHDAFHEMALFRAFVVSGSFPISDLFAYTPTVSPSVHHEWGTGAILYFVTVTTGLGLWGLTILKFALIGGMWSILYRVGRLRGVHPYLFAIFAITVFPTLWVGFATIRATLFTLLFLSIQLWMHEVDRRGNRLWLIGWWIMLVVWLNVHAGFVVGLGLLGLHAIERFACEWYQQRSFAAAWRATRHLTLTMPMLVAALPMNPYGWQYFPYLVKAIGMPRPLISEWQPLWHTHDPVITMIMFGFSIVLVALSVRKRGLSRLLGILGICICAVMALKHLRHGSIYSVVWIAYVPAWLSQTHFGRDLVKRIHTHRVGVLRCAQAIAASSIIWCLLYPFWITTVSGDPNRSSTCYPTGAVGFLRDHHFIGNLLTPFHAGSFVSWELHPHVKVSLDGRYEVAYEPRVFDEHWQFFEGESHWEDLLDAYPHDAILVNQSAKVRPMLEKFRRQDSNWRFIYEDDAYVILARQKISRLGFREIFFKEQKH